MDLVLKAWGQENSTPFTRWEIKRNANVIIFRQEEYPRTIGVRVGEIERVKVNWRNTFETPCPREIEGKPIIFIDSVRFGFENNGTEIFLYWMKENPEQELLFEITGGDHIIRHIQVSKDEILSRNINRAKSLIATISYELSLDQKVHPWNLTISGYDYDPRPLSEIPEVVIWYKKVHEEISYLPIFLTPFALNPYLLSVLDAKMQFSRKTALSDVEIRAIEDVKCVVCFKTDEKKVEAFCRQISLTGCIYLRYLGISKHNQKHILSSAFERIRSALKSV